MTCRNYVPENVRFLGILANNGIRGRFRNRSEDNHDRGGKDMEQTSISNKEVSFKIKKSSCDVARRRRRPSDWLSRCLESCSPTPGMNHGKGPPPCHSGYRSMIITTLTRVRLLLNRIRDRGPSRGGRRGRSIVQE